MLYATGFGISDWRIPDSPFDTLGVEVGRPISRWASSPNLHGNGDIGRIRATRRLVRRGEPSRRFPCREILRFDMEGARRCLWGRLARSSLDFPPTQGAAPRGAVASISDATRYLPLLSGAVRPAPVAQIHPSVSLKSPSAPIRWLVGGGAVTSRRVTTIRRRRR